MGWIEVKSVWLDCPDFADVFEGCEALESFEPTPVIVCVDEVVEVGGQLGVAVVMVSFDGRLLDRAGDPFDLPVGPWMLDLGESVLDAVFVAAHVEHVGHAGGSGALRVTRREGGLDTPFGEAQDRIVGQHGMDFVRHRLDQAEQEVARCCGSAVLVQFDESELAGAVDRHEHVELALLGAHLGHVDMGPKATPAGR